MIGKAGNGVVSLGDGGEAIVTFDRPVTNLPGPDFVIFENGFITDSGGAFLELAYVEVSSDGLNYSRFDAVSNVDTLKQTNLYGTDASLLNNLAGKYILMYGTPFDLEELKDMPGLDVNRITHIRIIDVVGCIQNKYARRDSRNRKINDPWPTPFASGGFDLDGVGVMHVTINNGLNEQTAQRTIAVYPNPATAQQELNITLTEVTNDDELIITDVSGRTVLSVHLNSNETIYPVRISEPGLYFVRNASGSMITRKILINR